MSIPTVAVTCIAYDQNGNPVIGGLFRARLNRTETYNGFVVPEQVTGIADANGVCILQLWPNALGVASSSYRINAINPDTGQQYLNTTAVVPNSACNLHEIIVAAPFPPVSASEQALTAAQGALASVTAQAGIATAAANNAEDFADDAEDFAVAAQASAVNASASFADFDKRYLGTKSSDPIVDNEGNALQIGALYYLVDSSMRIYDGNIWSAAYISESGTLTISDIGATIQAQSENLNDFAAKTAPAGVIVGTTDTQTLTNKSISGSANTLTNIANASLVNQSVTVNGQTVNLGASTTVTAAATNPLTIGTGLNGASYNGSAPVTVSLANTAVTPGAYGSASQSLAATVNAQGQLTALSANSIAIASTQVSGLGTLSTQNANNVAVTGGTIDGATVGSTTAAAGAFTTLTATSATLNGTTVPASKTLVTTDDTQTLTNKTLTSPAITTPTGIVKGDVGLGNVDNTSDATKNSATATLTNKTINLTSNTLQATSAQLAAAVTDETGTGALVFANSPTLVTPALGTPASGVVTNLTGTASININGTVGATTASTGAFTTLAASGAVTLSGGTANGVAFANASKVLTTGSALTFNGTNLGIGTSSPEQALDVNGSAVIGFTGTRTRISSTATVGLVEFNAPGEGRLQQTGAFPLTFRTDGAERLRITSAGNVGIGTSSPNTNLEISTTVDPILRLNNSTNAVTAGADIGEIQFYTNDASTNGTGVKAFVKTVAQAFGASQGGADLVFGTAAFAAGDASEKMRIDKDGNVGIGTSSPTALLSINSATNGAYAQRIGVSDPGADTMCSVRIGFDVKAIGLNPQPAAYIGVEESSVNSVQGSLTFATRRTNNNTIEPTEAMRITSAGNVGIGVTLPGDKLEIGGAGAGIILASPNGTRYRITVNDIGVLTVVAV